MNTRPQFQIECGPERIILTDGLQPFGFRTASGKIIVQALTSFPIGYRPPDKNRWPGLTATVVSKDDGRTWQLWQSNTWGDWQQSKEYGLGPVTEGAATSLRDGSVLLLNWIAEFTGAGEPWLGQRWISRDDFATVDGPLPLEIDIPQARVGYDDGGRLYAAVTLHRTLLELPSGDLLATAYCWFQEDNTPSSYQPNMCKFRSVLLRSTDHGHHWRYLATIGVGDVGEEGFGEPVMVRLSRGPRAGRLICLMRTGSDDSPLYQAHSDDDGATWSEPQQLALRGVDPDLKELSDGTLVCSSGRRILVGGGTRHHEKGYYLAFSSDQGATWSPMLQTPPLESYAMTIAPPRESNIMTMAAGLQPEDSLDQLKPLERRMFGHGASFGPLQPGHRIWTDYTTVFEIGPDQLLLIYDVGLWGLNVRYIASRTIRVTR